MQPKRTKSTPSPAHPHDARSAAIQVLLQVDGDTHVQAALDTCLRKSAMEPRDKALCTELVYGYLRMEIRIEAILDQLLKNRLKLPREMQITLGTACYALLFLQRIPHHATVHWAVDYVRRRFGLGLSKVCNGVLRSFLRLDNAPMEEAFYSDRGGQAAFYCIPQWMHTLWVKAYGEEVALKIMKRSLAQPRTSLRLNPKNAQCDALQHVLQNLSGAQRIGFSGWTFATGQTPLELCGMGLAHWHDVGALSWQAAGSQVALYEAFTKHACFKQYPLWDACAGQGGKTLALWEQDFDVLVSSDTSVQRLQHLRKTALRLDANSINALCMSALEPALHSWHGNILLDVPCSGLGTLARRPEIRKRRTAHDIQNLAKLQSQMLQKAWNMLLPERAVVYMTCTLNPAENEEVIQNFVASTPSAKVVHQWQTSHDNEWMEGMFAAVLLK